MPGPAPQSVLSIIIPTYNRLPYLRETLDHLYAHLPERVEVIVVDDGSTDSTARVVTRRYAWVRLLVSERRGGPGTARNLGLGVAEGRYFLPLDSDCFIVPETLNWLTDLLENTPEQHLLLSCRPWSRGRPAAPPPYKDGPYTFKDILLKKHGEVIPVLQIEALRRHGLAYPSLFAGGEPLLWLKLSQREPLHFRNRVVLEYRTDLPMRISSTEYQLAHAAEIAEVFEALLPLLVEESDPEIREEKARTLVKAGIYRCLSGHPHRGRPLLRAAMEGLRLSAPAFWCASFLPTPTSVAFFSRHGASNIW